MTKPTMPLAVRARRERHNDRDSEGFDQDGVSSVTAQ